ncbi:Arsenical resistance operon trans-acting repressor ArsD [Austwickia chelonae]|uniref:Arsenic resistance operon repressor ArsD n=1 Tax=Austwickia chelonae NBRC 105200 TaxID=1184607 RepID=K6WAC5_9MICO|nr:arsenite efflux transporter metallochaperone ArsD [Austwickia chelonae]GAB78792.1 arsenic resistance operon repressor ArsD [Austwickia chelonae NBRC 105200]SEV84326.1 Arsenical resistance operon trans-acting repressor ArsD [Austwickia chelonae]
MSATAHPTPAGPVIHVFEPALCCNTGVCGPDVDPALVRFTADLDHLRSLGVDITRHNLAHDPAVFAAEPTVAAFLRTAGSAHLPLTLVDGVTVTTDRYPSRDELLGYAGLATDAPGDDTSGGRTDLGLTAEGTGCCGGKSSTSGCC